MAADTSTPDPQAASSLDGVVADPELRMRLEAAAFRRLVAHLQARTDVQNIDLMILADFCRNCLGKWYQAAAVDAGLELTSDAVREGIYGMPYAEWKATHQLPATPEQLAALKG